MPPGHMGAVLGAGRGMAGDPAPTLKLSRFAAQVNVGRGVNYSCCVERGPRVFCLPGMAHCCVSTRALGNRGGHFTKLTGCQKAIPDFRFDFWGRERPGLCNNLLHTWARAYKREWVAAPALLRADSKCSWGLSRDEPANRCTSGPWHANPEQVGWVLNIDKPEVSVSVKEAKETANGVNYASPAFPIQEVAHTHTDTTVKAIPARGTPLIYL